MYVSGTHLFGESDDPVIKPAEVVAAAKLPDTAETKIVAKIADQPANDSIALFQKEFLKSKYEWQVKALKNKLAKAEEKIRTASLYSDVIAQYYALSNTDKQAIHLWIKKHNEDIRKFKSGRTLEQKTKDLSLASELLAKEIDYLNTIKQAQAQGIKVSEPKLKSIKPTEQRLPSSVYTPPKIKPEIVSDAPQSAIKKQVADSKKMMGLGFLADSKPIQPKGFDDRVESMFDVSKFKETVKTQGDINEQKQALLEEKKIPLSSSKADVDTFWLKKEIIKLRKDLNDKENQFKQISSKIKQDLTQIKASDGRAKLDTTVLGILIEAKPERFVVSPNLLQSINGSFAYLANGATSVTKAADAYLEQQAAASKQMLEKVSAQVVAHQMITGKKGAGLGDTAEGVTNAITNAAVGITQAITLDSTARARAKAGAKVATEQARQATEQARISASASTEQAKIGVERIGTTYSTLTKLVVGVGVALAGVMVAGGLAFRIAAPTRSKK